MTYSMEWLLAKVDRQEPVKYLFFWGHQPSKDGRISPSCFSQWWEAPFQVEGIDYKTAEHWMMAQKAILFNDTEILQSILKAKSPAEAKKLGRKVRNFDEEKWVASRYEAVIDGNYQKFNQHPDLKAFFQLLVESTFTTCADTNTEKAISKAPKKGFLKENRDVFIGFKFSVTKIANNRMPRFA